MKLCFPAAVLLHLTVILAQVFDPTASDNVAVYFGHSPGNSNASLNDVCSSASVDIIILGFIRGFNGLDILPTFDITKTCQSKYATASGVIPGCLTFATDIGNCQNLGKKIMLSVGGSTSSTSFNTSESAEEAAQTLWDLFGSGTGSTIARPFGGIILDGFDFNQETGTTDYFDVFASALRFLFQTSPQVYFLSVAPSCANTTFVFTPSFYLSIDFVWPRFYDAEACNPGSPGFASTLAAWDEQLNEQVGSNSTYPRLYVGGIDFDSGSIHNGFLDPENFTNAVTAAACDVRDRFGGVMLWDGTNGLTTYDDDYDDNFLDIVKASLTHEANCFSGAFDYDSEDWQYSAMLSPRSGECVQAM